MAAPVSSTALPVDGSIALPEPLRFLPLHSQPNESADSSPISSPDNASDLLESPVSPVLPDEAEHASPTNDITAQTQVLEVTSEPTSLNLDKIREDQSADDSLQQVIQALVDRVKLPQGSLRDYPEEARSSSLSGNYLSSRKASCTIAIITL